MPRFIKTATEVDAFRLTAPMALADGGNYPNHAGPGDWLVRTGGPDPRVEFFTDPCFRRAFLPADAEARLELARRLPGVDAGDRVSLSAADGPARPAEAPDPFDPNDSTLEGYACGDCGPLEGPARRPEHLPGLEDWEREDLTDDRTHDKRAP